ncbi:hypothetical protein EMCRGX_G029874 [Ephydatia muelleri]
MTRSVDQNWKRIQETTFTNWINSSFLNKLKTSHKQVQNLQTDLQDGTVLAELLENISMKSVGPYNKNPTIKATKLENLGTCLRFLEKEKVKVVNIGPEDIYGGNLKLILGLVWTLIRQYQIRSSGRDVSTKNAMLAWTGTLLPEHSVRNFTTDWNSGLALCALVEHIKPGSCPDYSNLNPQNGLANCELGIRLAEEHFAIPRILEAAALSNPDVDELSVMTYISYFCKPANENLMRWLRETLPDRNITNLTTDWNSGINLAYLVDAIGSGILPKCRQMDPADAIENLVQAMHVAEEHLQVKPFIKASLMADPTVDELNVAIYLSQLQGSKLVPPKGSTILCSGSGLSRAFVGRPANFQVDGAGMSGEPIISAVMKGQKTSLPVNISKEPNGVFLVTYTPSVSGKLSLEIKWDGPKVVSEKHYSVEVVDPGSFAINSNNFMPGQLAKLGKPVVMEAKGLQDMADLVVTIQHPDGQTEVAKVVSKGPGSAEVSYVPVRLGSDDVIVTLAAQSVPGSPFKVVVVDPSQCSVSVRDPPTGHFLVARKEATLAITGNTQGLKVVAKSSNREQELSITPQGNNLSFCKYVPLDVGQHIVSVTCEGENIKGSPLHLSVSDTSKVVMGSAPKYLQIGAPAVIKVGTKDAGPGQLECTSSNTAIVVATVANGGDQDLYTVKLLPVAIGDVEVRLTWGAGIVPSTPFTVCVCDASQCSAYGHGLTSGTGKVGEQFDFTVQATHAGHGELVVRVQGPKTMYLGELKFSVDGTYNVRFITYEIGKHAIDVRWAGVPIPNSPYMVDFTKGVDASHFVATGDGLGTCVALKPAKCLLVGPVGDLVKSGLLHVNLLGHGFESKLVSSSAFKPTPGEALVTVTESKKGTYELLYSVPVAGQFSLSITIDEAPVPGSPFQVHSLPTPDASKCKSYGNAIENPLAQVMGQPLEFKVDSTLAGTGVLKVKSSKRSSKLYTAQHDTAGGERINSIKFEPTEPGVHTIEVLWDDAPIPGSPFNFTVVDPSAITVLDLPNAEGHTVNIGEPFTFTVNVGSLDMSLLKTGIKLNNGRIDPLTVSKVAEGVVKVSYTPKEVGVMELLLTYAQVNLLGLPWICPIVNPALFQVTPVTGYCQLREPVKFTISGLAQRDQKLSITAVHKTHNAVVKLDQNNSGIALAQFAPKQLGEYVISVMSNNRHISGSPFSVLVSNPEACVVASEPLKAVHVGQMASLKVETSKAGPGELTCGPTDTSRDLPVRVKVGKIQSEESFLVCFSCDTVGTCDLLMTWAGYPFPNSTFAVSFVDASKAKWSCDHGMESGVALQGDAIRFSIDCSLSGNGRPELRAMGPKAPYVVPMEGDGVSGIYTAVLNPYQLGKHEVTITLAGMTVGTPLEFLVIKEVSPSTVTAVGEGLSYVVCGKEAEVKVVAHQSGLLDRGILTFDCTSDTMPTGDPSLPKLTVQDNSDGTYTLKILAPEQGQYSLLIDCHKKPISGSPFALLVRPAPDASKCIASGPSVDKAASIIGTPVLLNIDTTDAGFGHLGVGATDPHGQTVRIYAVEERGERTLHHLKFDPELIGYYVVNVTWEGVAIPGSPFRFNVVDPSKCVVSNFAVPKGGLPLGQELNFSVDTHLAGHGSPVVIVTENLGEPVTIKSRKDSDSEKFDYSYQTTKPGILSVDVLFGESRIRGCPLQCKVTDSDSIRILGIDGQKKCALISEVFFFEINGKVDAGDSLMAVAHGPSADLKIKLVEVEGGQRYKASFTPVEAGSYEIFVDCAGSSILGSPFTLKVVDPSKCQVLGAIPNVVQVGATAEFVLKTRGAGPGNLTFTLDGHPTSALATCSIGAQGQDTYNVRLTARTLGVMDVALLWADYDVPHFPIRMSICDARQCKMYGQVVVTKSAKVGEAAVFTVVTLRAGQAKLSVVSKGPTAQYNVDIRETKPSTHEVAFTPWEVGQHLLNVFWGDEPIPGSPLIIAVKSSTDGSVCNASGAGLNYAIAGQQASFTIISSQVGMLEKGALKVSVSGVQSSAEVIVNDNNDGSYTAEYTAPLPGAYLAAITCYDKHIAGSPFKVKVMSGADASKCRAYGGALNPNAILVSGNPLDFFVDTKEAGHGNLRVYVQGPEDYRPRVFIADESKGQYSIKCDTLKPGKYFVVVVWSEQHIPGSPFKLKVLPAPNAAMVKVFGPGLQNGLVGDKGQFTIDTRNAGMGSLLIKVHGIKDSFKVTADPTPEDKRTLIASYSPKMAGTFSIFVRWSGEHVPGSPFKVIITRPPGHHSKMSPVRDSADLELHELANLDEADISHSPTSEDKGKGKKKGKGKEKGKIPKSATADSIHRTGGPVAVLRKSTSTNMFGAPQGHIIVRTPSGHLASIPLAYLRKVKQLQQKDPVSVSKPERMVAVPGDKVKSEKEEKVGRKGKKKKEDKVEKS